ncbi:MAG: ATP-binding cassette domain-containing protein [Clostridia bacterium]|nr:ATP-binding cassette domain-containing protein [Clostridia bacterium]
MAKIKIDHLSKSYPDMNNGDLKVPILNDICLEINEGEFITFFGPNGCGKTSLLKVIAGVEPYEDGSVFIDSNSPKNAKTGLIFQNYGESLMPWLNCRQNILFPYSLKKRKKGYLQAEEKLSNLLRELNLELPLTNYPYQLSGGQQQLVSILRTLIYQPDVILMDEPFSALDFQTRYFMQKILLDLWRREKQTILFISHDIEEAIFLADKLVLLSPLPGSIIETRKIPFVRPRTRELFESDDFFHIKKECLRIIQGAA